MSLCILHATPEPNCVACQAWSQIEKERQKVALKREQLEVDRTILKAEKTKLRNAQTKMNETNRKLQSQTEAAMDQCLLHKQKREEMQQEVKDIQALLDNEKEYRKQDEREHEAKIAQIETQVRSVKADLLDANQMLETNKVEHEEAIQNLEKEKEVIQNEKQDVETRLEQESKLHQEIVADFQARLEQQDSDYQAKLLAQEEDYEGKLSKLDLQLSEQLLIQQNLENQVFQLQGKLTESNEKELASKHSRMKQLQETLAAMEAEKMMLATEIEGGTIPEAAGAASRAGQVSVEEEEVPGSRAASMPEESMVTSGAVAGDESTTVDPALLKLQQQLLQMQAQQDQYLSNRTQQRDELLHMIQGVGDRRQELYEEEFPQMMERANQLDQQLDHLEEHLDDTETEGPETENFAGVGTSALTFETEQSEQTSEAAAEVVNPRRTDSTGTERSNNSSSNKLRHVTEYQYKMRHSKLEGKYTGYLNNQGDPHGHGRLRFNNGDSYEGEWHNGKQHGHGVYNAINGDMYTGPWEHGQRCGHGVLVYANGSVYDGDFVDDTRHGKGILNAPDGSRYEGDFKNGVQDGQGIETFTDGRCYTGEFMDDLPHGQGVETAASGSILHEGIWEGGQFVGQ